MGEIKKIWDNYKVIAEVQKSAAIKLVVAAAVRDGIKYVNIREFYLKKSEGIWKPGRDGVTIPVDYPLDKGTKIIHTADNMVSAIVATMKELETLELFDEEHAVYYEKP